jgi:hypothetical protein
MSGATWGASIMTSGTTRLWVGNNGLVGIGTTSPGCNLEAVGTSGKIEVDANNAGLRITRTDTGDCYQQFIVSGQTYTLGIDNSDSDKFVIKTGTSIGGGSGIVMDSSGNFGINTTGPSPYRLYVSGTTKLNGDTTIAGSLTPDNNGGRNLGGPSVYWKNCYFEDTVINGTQSVLGVASFNAAVFLAAGLKDDGGDFGTNGQVLSTNGSNAVHWVDQSGGGGGGTVTEVTVGTGLDVSNGTTTPNITLDLNELSTAGTVSGTDDFVVIDGSSTRKEQMNTINLSGFSGYYGLINRIYKTPAGSSITPDSSGHIEMAEGTGVSLTYSSNKITFATGTSSDYRLKKNISNFNSDAWAKVKSVNLRKFDFDEDAFKIAIDSPDPEIVGVPKSYTDNVGFIAHELAEVGIEGSVIGEKDAVDADGNLLYQKINYIALVPALWGALNEAISKIETLESKVQALENK